MFGNICFGMTGLFTTGMLPPYLQAVFHWKAFHRGQVLELMFNEKGDATELSKYNQIINCNRTKASRRRFRQVV